MFRYISWIITISLAFISQLTISTAQTQYKPYWYAGADFSTSNGARRGVSADILIPPQSDVKIHGYCSWDPPINSSCYSGHLVLAVSTPATSGTWVQAGWRYLSTTQASNLTPTSYYEVQEVGQPYIIQNLPQPNTWNSSRRYAVFKDPTNNGKWCIQITELNGTVLWNQCYVIYEPDKLYFQAEVYGNPLSNFGNVGFSNLQYAYYSSGINIWSNLSNIASNVNIWQQYFPYQTQNYIGTQNKLVAYRTTTQNDMLTLLKRD